MSDWVWRNGREGQWCRLRTTSPGVRKLGPQISSLYCPWREWYPVFIARDGSAATYTSSPCQVEVIHLPLHGVAPHPRWFCPKWGGKGGLVVRTAYNRPWCIHPMRTSRSILPLQHPAFPYRHVRPTERHDDWWPMPSGRTLITVWYGFC